MQFLRPVLERMFARPRCMLGLLGGMLMTRTSDAAARRVVTLLDIQPDDRVVEVGFGPGVGIHYAAEAASKGFVAGIDPSETTLKLAGRRNSLALQDGRVVRLPKLLTALYSKKAGVECRLDSREWVACTPWRRLRH